jgi:hypothetical protein
MMACLKRTFVLLMVAALMPGTAGAQALRGSHTHPPRTRIIAAGAAGGMVDPAPFSPVNLKRLAAGLRPDRGVAAAPQRPVARRHVMGMAIAIGIGAGVGGTALAASKYGANEGGEFCGTCFARWSAISIPVGAGVGAAIGYLLDRGRH